MHFTELDGLKEGGENSGQVFNTPFPDRFPAVSTFTTLQLFSGVCLIILILWVSRHTLELTLR